MSILDRLVAAVAVIIAAIIGKLLVFDLELATTYLDLQKALSNHARFEGTWTPREMRLEKIGRRLDREQEALASAEMNHARFEGATLRPREVGSA